jgi:oxygen-independent coproporphyrinogen-3 oxidase
MAGIYIHVPFCKKICSYCDFYKSALLSIIPDFITAVDRELELRKGYLGDETVETVYLGGGTPSVLTPSQINHITDRIRQNHRVSAGCEFTMEANPDDLTPEYLRGLKGKTEINRLSIGIQSFNEDDLVLLHRRHNADQALSCITEAKRAGFANLSIDMIYGLPGMKTNDWKRNLDTAFSLDIQHLSAYHLTLEPGTELARKASRGLLEMIPDQESSEQFMLLGELAREHGFVHYEISNLSRKGLISRHNSGYWSGKNYLGLGPAAHSYDGLSRQWNVSDIKKYMDALENGGTYFESEVLDQQTRFNEYLMVSLRTMWGVNLDAIKAEFGDESVAYFVGKIQRFLADDLVIRNNDIYTLSPAGWLISDFIISRLIRDHDRANHNPMQ